MKRSAEWLPQGAAMSRRMLAPLFAAALLVVSAPIPFGPAVLAQGTEPQKPADFKAMETPGQPAPLVTAPGASLITPPTGPANPPAGFTGSKMVMTERVWQDYVKYLRNDVAIGYGLFMISVDGRASDVKRCPNYACQISPITRAAALDECQAKMNKRRCVVFAEGRDIKYAYQVVP